jgi:hypothetical protein
MLYLTGVFILLWVQLVFPHANMASTRLNGPAMCWVFLRAPTAVSPCRLRTVDSCQVTYVRADVAGISTRPSSLQQQSTASTVLLPSVILEAPQS